MKSLKTLSLVFTEILFLLKMFLHLTKPTVASVHLRRISDSVSSNGPRNLQFFQSLVPLEMWTSSVCELLISRLRYASLVVARVLMRSSSAFNRLIQLRSSAYWESIPLSLVISGVLTSLGLYPYGFE